MKEITGVMSPVEVFDTFTPEAVFKREALLFTKIAVPHLTCLLAEQGCSPDSPRLPPEVVSHLEWLLEREVIVGEPLENSKGFSYDTDERKSLITDIDELERLLEPMADIKIAYEKEQRSFIEKLHSIHEEMRQRIAAARASQSRREIKQPKEKKTYKKRPFFDKKLFEKIKRTAESIEEGFKTYHEGRLIYGQYMTRIATIDFRYTGIEAHPVFYSSVLPISFAQTKKQDVLQIILKALPMPDDSTSWEQILDYRSDPDSQGKFLALKNWANEVSRALLTPNEIEDKLDYLIHEYELHMRRHKMKIYSGVLQTLIVGGTEALENGIKLKLGKLANQLFFIRNRRIALLEAESAAPGKEIAYIVKTRNRF